MSGGHFFEHKAAFHIFRTYPHFFLSGQVELVADARDLYDFVDKKYDQYAHIITATNPDRDYSVYANGDWERRVSGPLVLLQPKIDTTKALERELLTHRSDSEQDSNAFGDTLEARGKRAITIELFRQSHFFNDRQLRSIAREISVRYTQIYTSSYMAAAFVGSGLVDAISEDAIPRRLSYRAFEAVYEGLGLNAEHDRSVEDWTKFRGTGEHVQLVENLRTFVQDVAPHDYWKIHRALRRYIGSKIVRPSRRKALSDRVHALNGAFSALGCRSVNELFEESESGKSFRRAPKMNDTDVFVVYGRDEKARRSVFTLLRAMGLNPLEFEEARKLTKKASPYIGEVIDVAMASAKGIVVLLTPDELVTLKPSLATGERDAGPRRQPRANVVFEAGMALSKFPDRVILVKIGDVNLFSDLDGRHYIALTNAVEDKQRFKSRLVSLEYIIDDAKTDWMSATIECEA